MKIIIDVPDRIYKILQNKTLNITDSKIVETAVKNGIPLSKPHGRIIDESKITSFYYHTEEAIRNNIKAINTEITHTDAPTIIESEV